MHWAKPAIIYFYFCQDWSNVLIYNIILLYFISLCPCYIPGASKTRKIVGPGKKSICFEKNRVFVKNPHVDFGCCWICTNLSKSGGPVSNFSSLHVAISYWQPLKSVRQKASVITHDARILHRLQLPPMLRTFPSAGLEVVKKSLWTCMAFQRSAFQIWTQ